jgi:hypothetical protein
MSDTLHTRLKIASWDENLVAEFDDHAKITNAHVTLSEGSDGVTSGTFHSAMYYRTDGTGHYSMLMRLSATLSGRSGEFMLLGEGTFSEGRAVSHVRIVEGSGTDALAGISGSCDSSSTQSDYPFMPLTLTFDFS